MYIIAIEVLEENDGELLKNTSFIDSLKTIEKQLMFFPICSEYCLRFRKKYDITAFGQYVLQSEESLKKINNLIISAKKILL